MATKAKAPFYKYTKKETDWVPDEVKRLRNMEQRDMDADTKARVASKKKADSVSYDSSLKTLKNQKTGPKPHEDYNAKHIETTKSGRKITRTAAEHAKLVKERGENLIPNRKTDYTDMSKPSVKAVYNKTIKRYDANKDAINDMNMKSAMKLNKVSGRKLDDGSNALSAAKNEARFTKIRKQEEQKASNAQYLRDKMLTAKEKRARKK